MKLDITPAAREDIRSINDYSRSTWGPVRARDYMGALHDKIKAVARGDLTGVKAEDVGPGLRRQVVGAHVIWFRVVGERLRVIRVLHQSMDAGRRVG